MLFDSLRILDSRSLNMLYSLWLFILLMWCYILMYFYLFIYLIVFKANRFKMDLMLSFCFKPIYGLILPQVSPDPQLFFCPCYTHKSFRLKWRLLLKVSSKRNLFHLTLIIKNFLSKLIKKTLYKPCKAIMYR